MSDYQGVGCEGCREALSARLDGEATPAEQADVDGHLAGCAECRRWLDDAAAVTRLVRTGPAVVGPDVTEAVLPAAPGRWRGRLAVGLRVGLAALGVAQLVLGLLQTTALRNTGGSELHATTVDGATPGHLWHESAAWNIAIGAGFLWVAARRGRPVGIVPILTAFIGALILLSAVDLVAGRVEAARLLSHVLVLAGYLIVLVLSRTQLDATPPDQRAHRWWTPSSTAEPAAAPDPLPDSVIPFPSRGRGQPAAQLHSAAEIRYRKAA